MSINATPYIWSCYILGFVAVFGIYLWLALQNKKIEKLKTILEKENKS